MEPNVITTKFHTGNSYILSKYIDYDKFSYSNDEVDGLVVRIDNNKEKLIKYFNITDGCKYLFENHDFLKKDQYRSLKNREELCNLFENLPLFLFENKNNYLSVSMSHTLTAGVVLLCISSSIFKVGIDIEHDGRHLDKSLINYVSNSLDMDFEKENISPLTFWVIKESLFKSFSSCCSLKDLAVNLIFYNDKNFFIGKFKDQISIAKVNLLAGNHISALSVRIK